MGYCQRVDANSARHKLDVARTLLGTGMITPTRPDRLVRSVAALRRWGTTPAAAYEGAAIRYPDRLALVDERGTLTFAELHRRTNALANELAAAGIGAGVGVAIMCRNHRGFVETTLACSKLGARALYLNTMFAAPQIADVLEREHAAAVIFDEEFAGLVGPGAEDYADEILNTLEVNLQKFLAAVQRGRDRLAGRDDEPAAELEQP